MNNEDQDMNEEDREEKYPRIVEYCYRGWEMQQDLQNELMDIAGFIWEGGTIQLAQRKECVEENYVDQMNEAGQGIYIQPENIDCLIEMLLMLKAKVDDPATWGKKVSHE